MGLPTPRRRDRGATLARAALVLDAVARRSGDRGVNLAELSREIKLQKSTTHRLLIGLEQIGFVRRAEDGERYTIGVKLVELAGKYLDGSNLSREAAPILYDTMLQSGETVNMAILDGSDVVYIAKVESAHSVRLHSRVGDRRPAYTSALGKAMMAWKPSTLVEDVIAAGLPQRTPKSITDPDTLRACLAEVRAKGYAVDDEETTVGVRCVAAPIFDYRSNVVAAVSIAGPTMRVRIERIPELAQLAKDAASRISERMGYRPC